MFIIDLLNKFLLGCWDVLLQMSPYLLFGFLIAGVLSVIISPKMIEKQLGRDGFWSVLKAAILGVPLPLCSCSVIPVSASFKRHGASKGAVISFLSSTPETGVDSIMVTYGMLGLPVAIFRVVTAFLNGIIAGTLVNLLVKDANTTPNNNEIQEEGTKSCCCSCKPKKENVIKRIFKYAFITIPEDIAGSLLLGILLAGALYAAVPDDFFAPYLGNGLGGMFVVLLISIPMYICATASVPLAAVLLAKGLSPGAILVFLIAGPATNIATITTVIKMTGKKAAIIYVLTIITVAMISGTIFNNTIWFNDLHQNHMHHEMELHPYLSGAAAIFMLVLMLYHYLKDKIKFKKS